MTEQEIIFKDILKKFSRFPIPEDESTFLDLCHYSGERFEEICSRILEFYFQPYNKHGFRNLWFRSLCELLRCDWDDAFEMRTRTEEYTFGADDKNKKIDIVIETPFLIVAIENKIGASLYNPIGVYKQHIERIYKDKRQQKLVVLTAHLLSGQEKTKANDHGFVVIQYERLFEKVKSLLGEYVARGDQKYLVFMLDFMQTVKNRVNMMEQTDLDRFFIRHRDDIEKLVRQYDDWKNRRFNQQKMIISELCGNIQSLTNDTTWWVYQGWDLGIHFNNNTSYKIGIESNFVESDDNPLAEYHIYFTTWSMQCWFPYENAILEKYPVKDDYVLDKGELNSSNRVYYHMPVIKRTAFDNDENYFDKILECLNVYYQFLKGLAAKVIMDATQ